MCFVGMEPNTLLSMQAAGRPLPIPATEPVLTLFDTLGPGHADGHALAREVWRLEAEGCQRIHVRINSAGGSVAQGYSLFSALRHTRMEVHTWADGLALSMAGLIFLAGQHRHMAPWSMLMLHNPSLTAEGEQAEPGNALILERIRLSILKMYEGVTPLEQGQLAQMMEAETWLTASDAVALGLATDFAGQAALPELEVALRSQAEAGLPALEEAVLLARPAQATAEANQPEELLTDHDALNKALEATHAFEQNLLGQLRLIETQLAALQKRLDTPAQTPAATAQGYVPLQQGAKKASTNLNFRELERRNPAALVRMQQEDPTRFAELYQAAYGVAYTQKGGAAWA